MSEVRSHSPPPRSTPAPDAKRPKGILKHASFHSPPTSPAATVPSTETPDNPLTDKELTLHNTAVNAGHRRSSSAARSIPSRRQSSRTPSHQGGDQGGGVEDETAMRLKWDEVNLYLTEQERTAKMKIDEPKTPYAKHYDPNEDPSDDEGLDGDDGGIPGLSLGEPEEEVPEGEFERRPSKVHVDDSSVAGSVHGDDDALAGLSPEEREKHKRFEQLRKKHYEMRNVAHLLGHSEELKDMADDEDDDDDDNDESGVPPLPTSKQA